MIMLKDLLQDNTRGATSIYKDAISVFLAENDPDAIKYGVEKLRDQFPVMGLFVNLWIQINKKDTVEEIHNILFDLSRRLMNSFNHVIENAGNQLPNECRIMTISHSSYVRELIINNKEKINIIYCLESAPEFEGMVLAKFLLDNGIKSQTIPDTSYKSPFTKITHVIVGSDLISKHFFINKSGTKELLEMAGGQEKHIWILGDELRFVSDYVPRNIPDTFEVIPMRDEYRVFCL